MIRTILRIAAFAVLLGITLCCHSAKTQPLSLAPLRSDATVLAFGDSLTDGVGGSGENYPQRLANLIGRKVVNAGLPGDTAAQGLARLASTLQMHQPDLLILCLGINDMAQGVPRERIRQNLAAMLNLARDAEVQVVLLALPQRGSSRADPLFAEVGDEAGVVVDERSMVEVLNNPALKADLFHANREGYRRVAELLAQQLQEFGALR